MIYSLFLLAHFTGDFLLQNSWIVEWKHRSWKGLIYHTGLVTLAFLVVLFPYLSDWRVGAAIGINFVLHSLQDQWKIRSSFRWHAPVGPFLIDQLMHITVALVLAYWVADAPLVLANDAGLWFYGGVSVPLFFLGVVLASYASDIFLYMLRVKRDGPHKYVRNYRSMLIRLVIFTAVFVAAYPFVT